MRWTRKIVIKLVVFLCVALTAGGLMLFEYIKAPALIGVGTYRVTVLLPTAGGLYPRSNVTYYGTEVGQVESVDLAGSGVAAVLLLKSGIDIPSDLDVEVHSQSAIGEQYVALLPRNATSRPLRNDDVIPVDRASVPPDINALLDATNRGLRAIPRDNLKTVIDESYTAIGGLGPEFSRIVRGANALAIDARANLDSLTTLIDESKPVLDAQSDTSDSVQAWAAHLATITGQLKDNDSAVTDFVQNGGPAADEARQLFERLNPTLPVLLANLVSLGKIAVTYRDGLEQILVLVPQSTANFQAATLANRDTKQSYGGTRFSFNLNLNLPPPCLTGFLPSQQLRTPNFEDAPNRPDGGLYCRVPQDSPLNVRGVRNTPCATVPGKRAPSVKMCESDEVYVPLNDGLSWKGDPNATLTGQGVPQAPPYSGQASAPPGVPPGEAFPPPVAVAPYDPATGSYLAPDGSIHTQSDLADTGPKEKTWQSMLLPPAG